MTPSEQRLHPASVLFDLARYARIFLWPALLAYFGSGGGPRIPSRYGVDTSNLEVWLWVLVVPSAALSVVRYLTFRVQYLPDELVIRSGLLFRNVRHVPYARIQNLDAVQTVVHRVLGVVDVRVETGSGSDAPEARLSVLPAAALDHMRARVFAGRVPATTLDAPVDRAAPGPDRTLVHLALRDLLLLGLIENKGMVLVGAAYGVLWEAGIMDRLWAVLFEETLDARGLFREVALFAVGRGALPLGRVALALGGVAGFLVLVRLVSMAWAVLRLWDFQLTRTGDDLRVTYGLFTRVTATLPLRRVQTVTVQRAWWARRLGRASIRVETAGGRAGAATRDREWLAPIIREADVAHLLGEVLPPAVSAEAPEWRAVHPGAFRRAVKPALLAALVPAASLLATLGWRAGPLALVPIAWAVWSTRQYVRRLAWFASDAVVMFRSGWLSQFETRVGTSRIQVVAIAESPFDRRAGMASVRVDTAGAGEWSHRIHIPYLDLAVARATMARLSRAAAQTGFHW